MSASGWSGRERREGKGEGKGDGRREGWRNERDGRVEGMGGRGEKGEEMRNVRKEGEGEEAR